MDAPVLALYDPFGVDVPLNFDIINQTIFALLLYLKLCNPYVVELHLGCTRAFTLSSVVVIPFYITTLSYIFAKTQKTVYLHH